jgi:hypothetical protein
MKCVMMDRFRKRLIVVGLVSMATSIVAAAAPPSAGPNLRWREECGTCHIAYPARLLPAASWRSLMQSLDKHFGVDATLDPATTLDIQRFLEAGAGQLPSTPTPEKRISRQPWFNREHSEVTDGIWRRNSVRSRANCGACHENADRGGFDEDGIKIPK